MVLKQEVNFRMLNDLEFAESSEAKDKRIQNISWYFSQLELSGLIITNPTNFLSSILAAMCSVK